MRSRGVPNEGNTIYNQTYFSVGLASIAEMYPVRSNYSEVVLDVILKIRVPKDGTPIYEHKYFFSWSSNYYKNLNLKLRHSKDVLDVIFQTSLHPAKWCTNSGKEGFRMMVPVYSS